jgi:Holliday junction resolvase
MMGRFSRMKGATAEREVANELFRELGMNFRRDLQQYQECERGDLVCEDPGFPFLIEIKRYANGWTCKPAWEAQVFRAAEGTGLHPAIFYRFDRQTWRVRVYLDAVIEAVGGHSVSGHWLETDIQGFAWIAREIMAGRAAS